MQKKLIALAIAGLGLSGAAFAQSNVTVYGLMDLSVDFTNVGDPAVGAGGIRTNKISSNSSRLGFKGSEDLGDGMKAIFQIESLILADTTAGGTLNQRNTFVGLAGGWGTVQLGHFDSPYKAATRGLDPFTDHLADNRNLMGKGLITFDGRPDNIIAYVSPTFGGGFQVTAAYIAGAEAATTQGQDKGKAWSFSGTYTNGPWYGTIAHERHEFGTAATGTLGAAAANFGGGTVTAASDKQEHATKIGVGYKDAVWRFGGVYETTNDDFNTTAASFHSAHHAWTLVGGYTFGINEIKLAYTKANQLDGRSDSGAKQWAIGVDRNLSKRTKVYAEYVKLTNEKNATYGLTGGASSGAVTAKGADADPSALSVGIRHNF